MFDAIWSAAAQVAVGIGTAVIASSQADKQEEYMQQLVDKGGANQELIEGIDRYFLGGGKASSIDIPGFSQQFGQLDYMREQQESMIDQEIRNSRQMIEDTMPGGGAKLRALAELSIKSQDAKNKINQEYEGKKNDLDVNLTNQYLQGAMGRQTGVPYGTQYAYGMQGLMNTQGQMSGLGTSLGKLAGSIGKTGGSTLQYTKEVPKAVSPVSPYGTIESDPYSSGGPWGDFDEYSIE